MSKVKSGDKVQVHYKGTLTEGGQQFDSSEGREPLEFTVGASMVIKGFDDGVLDMEEGEKRTLNIPAAHAYGDKNPEHIFEVPKENLPEEMKEPKVGDMLTMMTEQGQPIPVAIIELKDEAVVIDANHQLAGKDLTFDIELVKIN